LARSSNPRLAQLTKALRSNRKVLDELRRNNPIVENLLDRAMWANLPALEEYDRKGQVPETARLWMSSSFSRRSPSPPTGLPVY
jgi:hypothetical protein